MLNVVSISLSGIVDFYLNIIINGVLAKTDINSIFMAITEVKI